MSMYGEMDFMFQIVPIFIFVIAAILIGTIFINGIKHAEDKRKPIIPVEATVIAKRTKVWGDNSTTYYYVTFELLNGERMELKVPGDKYGFLVEGDKGILSFQGEIFVNFERKI